MKLPAVLAWALTFVSVAVLWVVFRAESLSHAWEMLSAMADVGNIALPMKFGVYMNFLGTLGISFKPLLAATKTFAYVFMLLLAVLFMPNGWQMMKKFKPGILWIVTVIVIAVMSFMNFSGITDFLYFQF